MKCILLSFLLALLLTACAPAADLADFHAPLDAEDPSAQVYRTDAMASAVRLGPSRTADILSMLRHAELTVAEDALEWDIFEYGLILDCAQAQLQMGWSPAFPSAVYAQWIRGGTFTAPIWLRNPTLPGKLLSYLPRQGSDWTMEAHWTCFANGVMTEDTALNAAQRLAVTLHCLIECEPTDRTPKGTTHPEYRKIELRSSAAACDRSHTYIAYTEDGQWFIEAPHDRVYRIPPHAIEACRAQLAPKPESCPITVTSNGRSVIVPLTDMDGAMYGQPLLPSLEIKPNTYGLPFSVYAADGSECKWYDARFQQIADERHWIEGKSPRYTNDFLGNYTCALKPGHSYLVALTVCPSPAQLLEGGGNTYYFKTIMQ